MKAIFALIVIYIGTFFVAIQGASNSPFKPLNTKPPNSSVTKSYRSAKKIQTFVRCSNSSGARDMIQEAANNPPNNTVRS